MCACMLSHFSPYDSPGKNTGVGCHFLLQYKRISNVYLVFVKSQALG